MTIKLSLVVKNSIYLYQLQMFSLFFKQKFGQAITYVIHFLFILNTLYFSHFWIQVEPFEGSDPDLVDLPGLMTSAFKRSNSYAKILKLKMKKLTILREHDFL